MGRRVDFRRDPLMLFRSHPTCTTHLTIACQRNTPAHGSPPRHSTRSSKALKDQGSIGVVECFQATACQEVRQVGTKALEIHHFGGLDEQSAQMVRSVDRTIKP